jgi:xylulokinase
MSQPFLLAIDVGSSLCKAVLFDSRFDILAMAESDIVTYHPKPMWSQQHPDEWWSAAVKSIKQVTSSSGVDPCDIKGVGVSGQSHGPVPLDDEGTPIYPCIVWADLRCIAQAEELSERLHRPEKAYYTPSKLLWLKQNEPEAWDQMSRFVLPKDYVRGRLTGRWATDETDARFTMMYDAEKGLWSEKHREVLGLPPSAFPDVMASDGIAGEITAKAEAETSLMAGTPVVAGAGDSTCVILGLHPVMEPERALIYLGTAPAVLTCLKQPLEGQPIRSWVNLREGYLYGQFMSVGGATLRWLKDNLMLSMLDEEDPYRTLDDEAEKAPIGSEGVMFLPHMMGDRAPDYNPYARGVIFGLSAGHTRGHVVRAIMEGVSLHLKLMLESMGATGLIKELIVSGGGANSPIWRRIISNVFDIPVNQPSSVETTALGLAFLISVGIGAYPDVGKASSKADLHLVDRSEPTPREVESYMKLYERYLKLERVIGTLFVPEMVSLGEV